MWKIFTVFIFMLTLSNVNYAQQSPLPEEEDDDIVEPTYFFPGYPVVASEPCFDIDSIQINCTPVYINVNVHFFLNDNCEGNMATAPGVSGNLNPLNAFKLSEDYINNANAFYETMSNNNLGLNYQWNAVANGADSTVAQCIPFRYVLKGVRIHCNSNAQSTNTIFTKFNNFFINSDSEINIFFSNVNGSANGFSHYNYFGVVVELFHYNLLHHEIAHALDVVHPFEMDEECDDTWGYSWTWDKNCDGIIDLRNNNCWNDQPIVDGKDACLEFCTPHPCCDESIQSNNIMAYSAWAENPELAALTPCQIRTMLNNLATKKCEYIQVGGCPPPSAFIGTIPRPTGNNKCETCFYLNGSFNESAYEMSILRPDESIVIATNILPGQAKKYCIRPISNKFGVPKWPYGLQSGVEYTMKLKVYSYCDDEDETEFKFTLPSPCADYAEIPNDTLYTIRVDQISPNPTSSYITVEYTTLSSGQLKVYGMNLNTNSVYGLVKNSSEIASANQQFTLDVSSWQPGVNTLIFEYDGTLIIETFIKN